jgi:hypothetical protein
MTTANFAFTNNSTAKPSPKQVCWLVNNAKDCGLALDMNTITTSAMASKEITRIQGLIVSGALIKTPSIATTIAKAKDAIVDKIWYAIIVTATDVSIKSFFGRYSTTLAKAKGIYSDSVLQVTSNIEFAKTKATDLRNSIVVPVTPQEEVACTSTVTELALDAMKAMSVDELKELATSMGIDIGRSKKHSTIMARILG